MLPATRPERPPSRPPLTSRIRASFEGKRKNSSDGVTSPIHTNGFITQDPEALRDAVDKAINSEAFQSAIAVSLAKLIKPSIKDALDTLQPVVEAVYSHEMLLRQTNQSVENILERMEYAVDGDRLGLPIGKDEWKTSAPHLPQVPQGVATEGPTEKAIEEPVAPPAAEQISREIGGCNAQLEAKLSELSGIVTAHNDRFSELVDGIIEVRSALEPTREGVDTLKSFSEQSNTTMSVIQAQLDQLKVDIGTVMDAVGFDMSEHITAIRKHVTAQDTSALSSHTTKLDAIATDLAALKGHSDSMEKLGDVSANLEALKQNVHAGITSSNDFFANLMPHIETIVTSVEGHTGSLAELKAADTNPEILAAVRKTNESQEAHSAFLDKIKEKSLAPEIESIPASKYPAPTAVLEALAADLASLKGNIQAGLTANNENVIALGAKVDDMLTSFETHRGTDPGPEILAVVQKLNQSQAAALEGVRSANTDSAPDGSQTNMEAQPATINSTLEAHATALEELKSIVANGANTPLGPHISAMVDILQSHTNLLNEIKDDVSAEILTHLHDIKESHTIHQTVLNEVREADVSDEILTALHTSNDSHTNHAAVLAELYTAVKASNDSHTAHAAVLEDSKTTSSVDLATIPGTDAVGAVDLASILATLEEQNGTLAAIQDATNASNESHVAHSIVLQEIRDASLASNESHTSHAATLVELKDIATASKDQHAAHAASLDEIKESTTASREFAALHETNLDEIKSAVNYGNDSHAAHAASFDEIKEFHASHAENLTELKSVQPAVAALSRESASVDLSSLKTHLITISSTLESHTTTLSKIRDATANSEVLEAVKSSQNLLTSSHTILTSQTSLLDTINEASSHKDILSGISSLRAIIGDSKSGIEAHSAHIKDLHDFTKSSHSDITSAIAGLALGGATGAGSSMLANYHDESSKEALQEIRAVKEVVEKSAAGFTSMAAQIDINQKTITTSITTLSDELKAEVDASGTETTSSISALNEEVKRIDGKGLRSALERHVSDVRDLSEKVDVLAGHVQSTNEQVEVLKEGVHFDERGIGPLKEHTFPSAAVGPGLAELSDVKEANAKPELEPEPTAEDSPFSKAEMNRDFEPEIESQPFIESERVVESEPSLESEPVVAAENPMAEREIIEEHIPAEPEESKEEEDCSLKKESTETSIEGSKEEPNVVFLRDFVEQHEQSNPNKHIAQKDSEPGESKAAETLYESIEHRPAVEKPIPDPVEPEVGTHAALVKSAGEVDPHDQPALDKFHDLNVVEESSAALVEDPGHEEVPAPKDTPHETSHTDEEDRPTQGDISPIEEYELFRDDGKTLESSHSHEALLPGHDEEPSAPLISPNFVHVDHTVPHEPNPSAESSNQAQEIEASLASPASEFDEDTASASTSAIASPLSPSFRDTSSLKRGKKDKRAKKNKKTPFVFDPEEEEG